MTVGVLALQGDYDAHSRCLQELGASVALVRQPGQLDDVSALVIPGGESSVLLKLLGRDQFWEKLQVFVHNKPCFGTCAGAILLASEVENPEQSCLGAMDIRIQRNAYGRQMQSAIHQVDTVLGGDPMEMVFIRAPRVTRVGAKVEILASHQGDPVWLRQGEIMVATFHPELSKDRRVHAEFLRGMG
ncbi:MAG: pyridoxal 5'-phosphate synthase glutaminase subunit PdxT [Betaproteobacteria bacterium]|nr:pyridoxal 5'-phosphate synthase glutaminase subunit PdxT [Betaproteobacteria bacterium]